MDSEEHKFYNAMNQEFDPSKEYGRVLRFDQYCQAYVTLAILQAKQVVPLKFWPGIQILADLLETCCIGPLSEEEKMPGAIWGIAWKWTPGQAGFSGVNGRWVFDGNIGCLRWTDGGG